MGQGRGVFYPLNLRINQRQYLLFYLTIVGFDSLFEIIGAIFVFEFHYHWDRLVCFHFCRHLDAIHHYLRMENLLVDAFVEVIGHRTMIVPNQAIATYVSNGLMTATTACWR